MHERGYDAESKDLIVSVDPRYFRPTEVETLLGGCYKGQRKIRMAAKDLLEELIKEMMDHDLNIAKRDSLIKKHGFDIPDFNE